MNLVPATHSALWTVAAPVTDVRNQVKPHVSRLRSILADGLGLGAPQCGIPFAFFLMKNDRGITTVCVNPEWYPVDANLKGPHEGGTDLPTDMMMEGCLTWPGRYKFMTRFSRVHLKWIDTSSITRQANFEGVYARLVQHECDHLQGGCIFPRPDGSPQTDPAEVGMCEADATREFVRVMAEQRKAL